MTIAEWQAVYDSFDLDADKCGCLLDPHLAIVDELIEQYESYGHHLMYVKWKDRKLCLDSVSRWQVFDMKVADPNGGGFYLPLSHEFDSLAVALEYPCWTASRYGIASTSTGSLESDGGHTLTTKAFTKTAWPVTECMVG